MIDLSRRDFTLVGFLSILPMTAVSGCLSDFPRERILTFDSINVSELPDGDVEITVVPEMGWTAENESWATFHDVSIVGYDDAEKEICNTELGTLHFQRAGSPVTVRCSAIPSELHYEAAEDACAERTALRIAVYLGETAEGHNWRLVDGC